MDIRDMRSDTAPYACLKFAWPDTMMPMMTPKRPNALPKISTTRIFTNRVELAASESAALLPTTPTQILHKTQAYELSWMIRQGRVWHMGARGKDQAVRKMRLHPSHAVAQAPHILLLTMYYQNY